MKREEASEGLNDPADFYEILDVKPNASPAEIREAYFRAKATYQKDNVALYTLIDGSEREQMLSHVEEAYQVLSNPERRREYDRFHGQLTPTPFAPNPGPTTGDRPQGQAKVISIDRASPASSTSAPMESVREGENPLVAPRTDIRPDFNLHYAGAMTPQRREPSALKTPAGHEAGQSPARSLAPPRVSKPTIGTLTPELEKEILEQTDWSGPFLRKVREARGVSIEEVTAATKITKAYLLAIEEENYAKLPAAVFVRGFVSQIARLLKLPHQQVAASFMARLQRARPEKLR